MSWIDVLRFWFCRRKHQSERGVILAIGLANRMNARDLRDMADYFHSVWKLETRRNARKPLP